MQAHHDGNQKKQALRIADGDVVQKRIRRQHVSRRQKEKGGVDKADDDRDLNQGQNDLGLDLGAVVVFGKEQHHQDRSAVEAVKQAPG